ncbi:MAG TPA: uroporphyrinogen-III C-methyltransferase [Methylophilaceae bacterium]|nr:uroporphyrinogen-III C-methyltransferase [Methylophilaceae bacterium]
MTEQQNLPTESQAEASSVAEAQVAGAPAEDTIGAEQTASAAKPSKFAVAALALAMLAVLILAWQWISTRQHFSKLEQTLTQRLEQYNSTNQQSLAIAKSAEERSLEASARTALLEQKFAESRDQQEALETLYRELADNREERILAEVEQLLVIANQQLQLAGNIKPALLALQTADSRLQHLDTPQVLQLRKTIAQDIQRLQSLPLVDVVGMSLKLESLANGINNLPLVSERHPVPAATPAPDWDSNPMHRLLQEIWHDLKQMVRLERVDRPEPPLLAPDQNFFLRENLRLRLLTARIALLQHDEATYRTDLQAAEQWLKGYFDVREASTQAALATIKELSASSIMLEVPDINESLGLVSKYKLSLERTVSNEPSAERHGQGRKQ